MFDLDPSGIDLPDGTPLQAAWWPRFLDAWTRGERAVRTFGASVRETLDDEAADELAVRFAGVFDLPDEAAGAAGLYVAAMEIFAGPRAHALIGAHLRGEHSDSTWKVDAGFAVLSAHRTIESAVQLRLCARDAWDVAVLTRAHELYRGWSTAMLALLDAAHADAPRFDLERYFALNLEAAMLWGTRFEFRELEAAVESPMRDCLSRVVWGSYVGGRLEHIFRVDPEGDGFLDAEAELVELAPRTKIGVPHRAELTPDQLDAWGMALADFEIVGLFPQLDREVMTYESALPFTDIDRTALDTDVLRFLFSQGWTRRPESRTFDFRLRGGALSLETRLLDDEYRLLERFVFRSGSSTILPGADHAIAYGESFAAAVRVLVEFAPDLI